MLPVIYRDKHLVAVHKPSGLLVHRTALDRFETRFALQLVRDQLGQRVYPVHRLDRGTSGLLLFALDADSAAQLGGQFAAHQVQKRYWAVVRGYGPASLLLDHSLKRERDEYEFFPSCTKEEFRAESQCMERQEAKTEFRRLVGWQLPYAVDRYPVSRYSLMEAMPETGRRHQIRRHLKHLSHPIIGDATYGKGRHNRLFTELFASSRLLLACVSMSFMHPTSRQLIELRCPLSEDFAKLLAQLQPYEDCTAAVEKAPGDS